MVDIAIKTLVKSTFLIIKVLPFECTFSSNDIKSLLVQNLVNYMVFSKVQSLRTQNSLK